MLESWGQRHFLLISMKVAYWLVRSVDPNQEEKFSYKKTNAEVLVDGVTVTLEPTEKAKCEDANQETNKGQQNSNPCDHIQKKVMDRITVLEIQQKSRKLHLRITDYEVLQEPGFMKHDYHNTLNI